MWRNCSQMTERHHAHPTHPGQEFVFVHAGEVELSHDGNVTRLSTGDCAYFDASAPHELRQVGSDTGVQAVVVVVACDAPDRVQSGRRQETSGRSTRNASVGDHGGEAVPVAIRTRPGGVGMDPRKQGAY